MGKSVLLADDDPISRHLLETWLQEWNYTVTAVDNGLDAWNVLQQENSPSLAILDWMMPAIDGLEICRRLRRYETGPYHYVLLVTARGDKRDVVAGLDAGADDYITKPFHVEELRARIRAGQRILQLHAALMRAHGALQFEAAHDPLTGLWNRGAILDLLRRELLRNMRLSEPIGVMMGDLDQFKRVNDSYGHLVGDSVLKQAAGRLAGAVRNYDLVGRYGGEEFLMVVPGCTMASLNSGAERLRECIAERPILTEAGSIPVTISIGLVSTVDMPPACDYEALLRAADSALYKAKANGRNRIETVSWGSVLER
jgi:diguanylate cyclase (GGDEF)-like protein